MRDELGDLLHHTSICLKSFVELRGILDEIPKASFDQASFANNIYFPATANLTSPFAADKARTHCTDIARDVNRLKFKFSKVMRTENLDLKGIDDAFKDLLDADGDFLMDFEKLLIDVDKELRTIYELLGSTIDPSKKEEAWRRYEGLRTSLHSQHEELRAPLDRMRAAEFHLRKLLT